VALVLSMVAGTAAAADSDGDGLRDAFEKRHGLTSYLLADSDGDGVIDAAEDHDGDDLGDRGEQAFGTDPSDPDSDDDGISDGLEDADDDGVPNRVDQNRRPVPANVRPALEEAFFDIAPHGRACGVRTGDDHLKRCHFGEVGSELEVVLLGDSKATMYLPPLITIADEEGWALTTMLKGRCTPVLGTMTRYQRAFDDGLTCRRWRDRALARLAQDPPDLVVLVFSDDYVLVDRQNRKLGDAAKVRALHDGLGATLQAMPAESTVVLLADAPKSTVNAPRCLRRNERDMSACLTLRVPASAARIDAVLRRTMLASGGAYRTLEDRICPYHPCPLVQGDILIYKDKGHLTVTFTRLLAPSLRAELAPLLPSAPEPAGDDAAPSPAIGASEPVLDPSPAPSGSAA
jgi:SGNH domain (fused to AT3 domains)